METQFFNALAQFVGENWAGFIVAACIAVCALAQTLMAPPTESSSAIYKIIYAVTAKFGGNFGKARNAVVRRRLFRARVADDPVGVLIGQLGGKGGAPRPAEPDPGDGERRSRGVDG